MSVGAADFTLTITTLDPHGSDVRCTPHPLAALLPPDLAAGPEGSEFQGLAADAAGRVFVLQEAPSQVLIFEPSLTRLSAVLNLVVDGGAPTRGHALVVVSGGRMLVATGVRLVEFDLPSEESVGMERTPPVHASRRVDCLAGLDDLAVDGAGELYAVSSASRQLVRLDAGDAWSLPRHVVGAPGPMGLAFARDGFTPLVAMPGRAGRAVVVALEPVRP